MCKVNNIYTYIYIYIDVEKMGGNKHILMIILLKNKNRSHILSPQKKVLVIVVA